MRVPLAVRAISRITFRAWFKPPPLGSRSAAHDAESVSGLGRIGDGSIPGFEVGSGPLVLALHGWGGRSAQMAPVARRLAERGFRVVCPDLPGRAGGGATDVKEVAAAVHTLVEEIGDPVAVVGHSFASMVMRVAFGRAAPRAVVLIAPLIRVTDALRVFSDRMRLLPWARRGLRVRLERWDRRLWPVVSTLQPDQFPGAEILILHDPEDGDAPFSASAELAAVRHRTHIEALPGTGHAGILADPTCLDLVADFVGDLVYAGDHLSRDVRSDSWLR